MIPLLGVEVFAPADIILARQRARQVARLLGFDGQDQTRITTAVSEVVRSVLDGGSAARLELSIDRNPPRALIAKIEAAPAAAGAAGPKGAQAGLAAIRDDDGMIAAHRLMDRVELEGTNGEGITVTLLKDLPRRMGNAAERIDLSSLRSELARPASITALDEVQRQNHDLVRALDELRARQLELEQLNLELADTNRGVMALYAEVDDKAQQLEKASSLKTSFLSHVSHELRTPLNSVLGLSQLLLERVDGPLTAEQERQVQYILDSAKSLTSLVDDLLDTAKIEAGKVIVDPQEFTVTDLFSSLRGMFRPMVRGTEVALQFDDAGAAQLPPLFTDEGRVAQILRNFLSNALKFTERGLVRVTAATGAVGDTIVFSVSDQGIGIAPEDQDRIFEEFRQVEGATQRRKKGTGLGLPLTRKLATILGGSVSLSSVLGQGSTFEVTLPRCYPAISVPDDAGSAANAADNPRGLGDV